MPKVQAGYINIYTPHEDAKVFTVMADYEYIEKELKSLGGEKRPHNWGYDMPTSTYDQLKQYNGPVWADGDAEFIFEVPDAPPFEKFIFINHRMYRLDDSLVRIGITPLDRDWLLVEGHITVNKTRHWVSIHYNLTSQYAEQDQWIYQSSNVYIRQGISADPSRSANRKIRKECARIASSWLMQHSVGLRIAAAINAHNAVLKAEQALAGAEASVKFFSDDLEKARQELDLALRNIP